MIRRDLKGLTAQRGYLPTWRAGESNRCPCCGASAWHVGRSSVECARCETALPIAFPEPDQPLPLVKGHA